MKRVFFVDDEQNVLDGLKRMLRPMRHEWEMVFLQSGEEALEALQETSCDVIVSDMRMKGMDGVKLLTEVKSGHPETVRIALSGHADMELVLECVGATHQYLAKPCDADTVRATIDRACALRDLLTDPELTRLVTKVGTLPSLPTLYTEIMEAIRNGGSLTSMGEIIAKDVAMTAKILKVVNSAFFGLSRHIESPSQAAAILGLDVVRSLVLTTQVFSTFEKGENALDFETLWRHSTETGALARRLAGLEKTHRKSADFAQMAGMLHEVGKLILGTHLAREYAGVAVLQSQNGISDWEAEKEIFGHSHTEIGAYLLGLWGLPNPIVEAVAYHHCPSLGAAHGFTPLLAVHVADCLLDAHAKGLEPEESALDMETIERLGFADRIVDWQAECRLVLEGE